MFIITIIILIQQMSTVTTYETLQTQGLVTVNFSLLSQNFRIIDGFIKAFPSFQRRLADVQKAQKTTAHQFSNFKLSTQNTFSTLTDVVESRSGPNSKGSSLADIQQMKQMKKQFKQIKTFITQNTRDQHEAQQTRDKQANQVRFNFQNQLQQLRRDLQQKQERINILQQQNRVIKVKYTSKVQLQANNNKIKQTLTQLQKSAEQVDDIQGMLQKLDVRGMKQTIDTFQNNIGRDFEELKRKLKLKADYSDVLKLQDMLLNIINFGYENLSMKCADKIQTKKALVYFQKKINKLLQTLFGQDQGDREGLVTTKGFKCISCTKDLGQYQGKLDKYKAWSVFPAKDPHIKDRYSGFGAGFQTIIESTVAKKGIEPSFDEKGKMTSPYNLTREVQGSLLKPSISQSKLNNQSTMRAQSNSKNSPTKSMQETNYMNFFGKNSTSDLNLKEQYIQKQRGLMSHIKYVLESTPEKDQTKQ